MRVSKSTPFEKMDGGSVRTVILTGSTGGLGKCLVREICELEDIELICTYRDEEKFQRMCDENKKVFKKYKTCFNNNYKYICEQIETDTEELVVILNAFSITPIKLIGTFEVNEVDNMIDGNIKQTVHLLNHVVYFCNEKNKKLRIINLDSGAADFPLTGWGNYCAAKSYVNAFLEVMALEQSNYKIVSIDPGVMDTNMQSQIREISPLIFSKVNEFKNYKEKGILRKPEVVAKYIVSRYLTDWKAINLREKID